MCLHLKQSLEHVEDRDAHTNLLQLGQSINYVFLSLCFYSLCFILCMLLHVTDCTH